MCPLTIAPLKPSSVTARSSSSAAASGAEVGSVAKPAKRSGCSATARASASFASLASAIAVLGVEVLDARRGADHDLQVDAGLVHRGQAALAEIGEVGLSGEPEAASGLRSAPIACAMSAVQKWSSMLITRMRAILAIRSARRCPACGVARNPATSRTLSRR